MKNALDRHFLVRYCFDVGFVLYSCGGDNANFVCKGLDDLRYFLNDRRKVA